ncbi:hypothetical protein SERLA73DRAFT_71618 [Serpula lacrymans var. lacrymans S7.3]|uniref:Uncharacterized protein n=2 Tax=Serpula lacrymans var. lacrymans TaxID=341189 RepID=F8PRP2_SERL3|nr:uncharacterized protein SERLADRAFT_436006 [Serpula lacrymans var. lacrymans S7.9]EGO00612.1 hypothetical protein SERLA73DRAFT_71618 [Serpula lacrymans var. lacrymans S7.3]EGO26169.1 hypothetical protein SERLADRAFT_436006 [Serpula lacrymans var. lacrymans S7.9]
MAEITFPITELSVEIVLEIIKQAATPDFKKLHLGVNPYKTAVNLCLVSHAFRAVALPQMLHSVILSKTNNIHSFIKALRIQRAYYICMTSPATHIPSCENYHFITNEPIIRARLLYCDYSKYVHRMWIGECEYIPSAEPGEPGRAPTIHEIDACIETDYAILAPVLFATSSLGIDFMSFKILFRALETVWKREYEIARPITTPLPWKITSLTLTGFPLFTYIYATEGEAFLSTLERVVLLIPWKDGDLHRVLPSWANSVSWSFFSKVKEIALPIPRATNQFLVSEFDMLFLNTNGIRDILYRRNIGWIIDILNAQDRSDRNGRAIKVRLGVHGNENSGGLDRDIQVHGNFVLPTLWEEMWAEVFE